MDLLELRRQIPALDETIYFNTGATGPIPESVAARSETATREQKSTAIGNEGAYQYSFSVFDETRSAVADFLQAAPQSIALTQSTADGINRAATAINWKDGDVIVRSDTEHPAGSLPWLRLQEQYDLEIRTVPTQGGHIDREAYIDAVSDAKLVCISSVCWLTGARRDVGSLVDIASDAGAITMIDAVQSIGQLPVDVTQWGADIVAASGHKWLLGLWGSGILYINPGLLDQLHPSHVGYRGITDHTDTSYQLKETAEQFEIGTTAIAPYAGLQESISVVDRIGIKSIQNQIHNLTDQLKSAITNSRLRSPREYESGLVSIAVDNPAEVVDYLADQDIRVRSLPTDDRIRVSVHAFNTSSDIEKFVSTFEDAIA